MSSTVPLIAPVVLPMTAAEGGYASVASNVQVTFPDPAVVTAGVDITITPGADQTLPDGTPAPLDTLIAPVLAVVGFLPAGASLDPAIWSFSFGPVPTSTWVLQPQPEASRPAMPAAVPEPGLYVLQGVADESVTGPDGVFSQWLQGLGGV